MDTEEKETRHQSIAQIIYTENRVRLQRVKDVELSFLSSSADYITMWTLCSINVFRRNFNLYKMF